MAFARASAIRGALKAIRPSSASVARPQVWRQIGRRGYASHGHETKKAGGDLPWAIGAAAVTVPTCWYLLQSGPDSHGHGGHDAGHGEEHGEEHDDENAENKPEAATESKDDDGNDEKSEETDSGDDGKDADTPDTSDDEGDSKSDIPKTSKGDKKTSPDDEDDSKSDVTKTPKGDKKTSPDSKGANKTRIESDKSQKLGKDKDTVQAPTEDQKDKPAASKAAGSQNTQSGKQEGLSNTDTKHSVDIENDPGKSKKGEGTPETSKSKGTVDPKRPQK